MSVVVVVEVDKSVDLDNVVREIEKMEYKVVNILRSFHEILVEVLFSEEIADQFKKIPGVMNVEGLSGAIEGIAFST